MVRASDSRPEGLGTTERRGRSHPPQYITSREDWQIVRMAATDRSVTSRTIAQDIESVTRHSVSARTSRPRLQQSGLSARHRLLGLPLTQNHRRLRRQCLETPWRGDVEQLRYARHTSPVPGIIVWGGIGYHYRFSVVRIAGTLNSRCYISEMLEPVVLPYLQGLVTAIFPQDNARPQVARIVQRFVNHQI
ncbi:transposable element Tcb1 transposase [Trichonephila clavipes]|nr:transposable element Tcb1 transposase [Trichonephila clavipes]